MKSYFLGAVGFCKKYARSAAEVLLVLSLVLTVQNLIVSADADVSIQSFEELNVDAAAQNVVSGTAEKDLRFPEGLTVMAVKPTQDTAGEVELQEPVEETVKIDQWTSLDKQYDPETAGEYTFTPVLPEGYVVKEDVELPTVKICVLDKNVVLPKEVTAEESAAKVETADQKATENAKTEEKEITDTEKTSALTTNNTADEKTPEIKSAGNVQVRGADAAAAGTVDYINETITGMEADSVYDVYLDDATEKQADPAFTDPNVTTISIEETWFDHKVKLVNQASKTETTVTVDARQPSPTNIVATPPTIKNAKNGKIEGVNSTMEYKVEGTTEWKACDGADFTGLSPAKYFFRIKSTDSKFASAQAEIILKESDKTVTVRFVTNVDGVTVKDVTGLAIGDKVTEPDAITKAGYTFGGWYTNDTFEENAKWDFTTNELADLNEVFTLYAKWTDTTAPVISDVTAEKYAANLWDWIIGKKSATEIHMKVVEEGSGAEKVDYVLHKDGETDLTKDIKGSVSIGSDGTAIIAFKDISGIDAKGFKGTIALSCTDKDGNTQSSSVSVSKSGKIILEDNAPDISFAQAKNGVLASQDIGYQLHVTVKDDLDEKTTGGLKSVTYQMNNKITSAEGKEVNSPNTASFASALTSADEFDITMQEAGSWEVAVKAIDNAGNESTKSIDVLIRGPYETPDISINYTNEELKGFIANSRYYINDVSYTIKNTDGDTLPLVQAGESGHNWLGQTLNIVRRESGDFANSAPQTLVVPAKPTAPEVSSTPETVKGASDGTISGVKATMEYKEENDEHWTEVTTDQVKAGKIENLPAGTYFVRTKAVAGEGGSFASEIANHTIKEGETVAVTFETKVEGLTVPSVDGLSYGVKVDEPKDVVRDKYTLEGWYTSDQFTEGTKWDFTKNTVKANTTLYAHWVADTFKLIYKAGAGVSGDVVTWNDKECVAETLLFNNADKDNENHFAKRGYSFKGWSTTENAAEAEYNVDTTIAELNASKGQEITLYPVLVDDIAPVIGNLTPDKEAASFLDWIIGKKSLTIKVAVKEDGNAPEGVTYFTDGDTTGKVAKFTEGPNADGYRFATVVLNEKYKGDVKFVCTDTAGNKSNEKTVSIDGKGGVIVEDNAPVVKLTDSEGNDFAADDKTWHPSPYVVKATITDSEENAISAGLKKVIYYLDTDAETKQEKAYKEELVTSDTIEIEMVKGGTHTLHVQAIDNAGNESALQSVTLNIQGRESTPEVEIDFVNEELRYLADNAKYLINDAQLTASTTGTLKLSKLWYGKTLNIVKLATDDNGLDSLPQTLAVPERRSAPADIVVTNETSTGANDGIISGLSTEMEIYMAAEEKWEECRGTMIMNLAPGSYKVRYKATDKDFVSPEVNVNIKAYSDTEEETGPTADVVVVPGTSDTPSVTLPDNKTLTDIVLTAEEKALLEKGTKVTISMQVDRMSNPSDEDVKLVSDVLGDRKVGMYLDINLSKQIGNAKAEKITETGSIPITVEIPSTLLPGENIERTYGMVRVHEGQATILEDEDANDKQITVSTGKFSTYALTYSDKEKKYVNEPGGTGYYEGPGSIPGTGDGTGTGSGSGSGSGSGGSNSGSSPKTGDSAMADYLFFGSMLLMLVVIAWAALQGRKEKQYR